MSYDLVIYGGTSAGIAAAVQAIRMGLVPVVVEPSDRIGGLTTGGLGDTDAGNKEAIGGLSLEFYTQLGQQYGMSQPVWMFEPSRASAVFREWVERYGIQVLYKERLDLANGVEKNDGNQLVSIRMESGLVISGRMFMDTSYEGDLMKLAGVSYTVGREANREYGETFNGIQTRQAMYHQLPAGIDPYRVAGDPSSGLLPGVHPSPGGSDGEGDERIQAYCYRMCLTDDPDNRLPIEQPPGYDEDEYELLFRAIERGLDRFFKLRMLPNRKTDSNNDKGFSTDYIGRNYSYPEAGYEERARIAAAHKTYQKGLVWTLQHHPRVPVDIRAFYREWGLPRDEFVEYGHWTPQLYIRESRRMLGDVVMNENHIYRRLSVVDSVGLGSYWMDSHHTQRYVGPNGDVVNEGDVQVQVSEPYPISYRSIVPRESECANLFVPVCLSASHIAYGSIRMEPVFMVLGQSAATAAALALEAGVSVQRVDYAFLRRRLLEDGQRL
ncbi:FAD-dependent oxidoreductase [Paenibacillus koleovorans]|uniref:FAD-dependent oxidoreductase n=1 Tax=Paenibacillus koleovorans TaxID=121608 RepID=UPI000FDA7C09|nr:FAD-dependent oxidoreductase [Paenibacillus koleovorans]